MLNFWFQTEMRTIPFLICQLSMASGRYRSRFCTVFCWWKDSASRRSRRHISSPQRKLWVYVPTKSEEPALAGGIIRRRVFMSPLPGLEHFTGVEPTAYAVGY